MRALISIIAYNEEKNIVRVIEELRAFQASYVGPVQFDIILIDNASTDQTSEKALSLGIPTIRHPINNGGSMGTVLTYFRYGNYQNYDILLQFDGDGQHIATELPKLIEPLITGEANYCIGSRYLKKEGYQSTSLRRLGIGVFNTAIKLVCGQTITDSTSGFRAYDKKIIRFFAVNFPHELSDPIQMVVLSSFLKAKIVEVPVVMRHRLAGISEFTMIHSLRFVLKGLTTVLGCYLQKGLVTKNQETTL